MKLVNTLLKYSNRIQSLIRIVKVYGIETLQEFYSSFLKYIYKLFMTWKDEKGKLKYILVYIVKIRFVVSKSAKIKANITECVLKHLLTEIFYFK